MKRFLSVVWFAITRLYDDLYYLAGMGILWFLISVTLPYVVLWLSDKFNLSAPLTLLLVAASFIPAPPATAAIYYVTSHIAREKRIEFGYFWEGLRNFFWSSWKVTILVLLSGAILFVDIWFYSKGEGLLFTIISLLGVWLLAFWTAVQVYLFPLLVSREQMGFVTMLKNAALLTLAYPLFAAGMVVVIVLVTALSLLLTPLLFTVWMPFVSLLNNRALVSSIKEVKEYRRREREIEAELRQ